MKAIYFETDAVTVEKKKRRELLLLQWHFCSPL